MMSRRCWNLRHDCPIGRHRRRHRAGSRILRRIGASHARAGGMTPIPIVAAVLALSPLLTAAADGASRVRSFPLDVHEFRVLGQDYDPENPSREAKTYYRTIDGADQSFIHSVYVPPMDTVTLFHEVPAQVRHGVRAMRWRWRALALPRNGNECVGGLGDSAAAVYVTWKRGLR